MAPESRTILFLERRPKNLETAREVLGKYGFHLLTAGNFKEGMELFIRKHVDLVIASTETIRNAEEYLAFFIKERTPDVPVIIIAGPNESPSTVTCDNLCVDSTISDPFESESIEGILRRHLSVPIGSNRGAHTEVCQSRRSESMEAN
jgi:response regulator RpfG family c-di-GMP phosphodiesterase